MPMIERVIDALTDKMLEEGIRAEEAQKRAWASEKQAEEAAARAAAAEERVAMLQRRIEELERPPREWVLTSNRADPFTRPVGEPVIRMTGFELSGTTYPSASGEGPPDTDIEDELIWLRKRGATFLNIAALVDRVRDLTKLEKHDAMNLVERALFPAPGTPKRPHRRAEDIIIEDVVEALGGGAPEEEHRAG